MCKNKIRVILLAALMCYNSNDLRKELKLMKSKIVAFIEKDIESGYYVAIVPGMPGAHTQAKTLDEL
jgi:hypothetical protein